MRHSFMGMYDRSQRHGHPTGSGPGFADAMRKFKARQEQYALPGKWRKRANQRYFRDNGTWIDPEYYVVDNMGNYIDGSVLDEVFQDGAYDNEDSGND